MISTFTKMEYVYDPSSVNMQFWFNSIQFGHEICKLNPTQPITLIFPIGFPVLPVQEDVSCKGAFVGPLKHTVREWRVQLDRTCYLFNILPAYHNRLVKELRPFLQNISTTHLLYCKLASTTYCGFVTSVQNIQEFVV